jgi:cytochrome c oxidase subunit 2
MVNDPAAAHIDRVLHGKDGTAMAAFGDQLDDVELAAVITYERAAWGNRGTPVLPADVKALRK